MTQKTQWEQGYEQGRDDFENEIKQITLEEFGKIALLLIQDHDITHHQAGLLLYKLETNVKPNFVDKK